MNFVLGHDEEQGGRLATKKRTNFEFPGRRPRSKELEAFSLSHTGGKTV